MRAGPPVLEAEFEQAKIGSAIVMAHNGTWRVGEPGAELQAGRPWTVQWRRQSFAGVSDTLRASGLKAAREQKGTGEGGRLDADRRSGGNATDVR